MKIVVSNLKQLLHDNVLISNKYFDFLGLSLLILYISIYPYNISTGDFVLKLLSLFGLLGILFFAKDKWKDFLLFLFLAAIFSQIFSWVYSIMHFPLWAESSPKLHRLGSWFLMIPVALFLGGNNKKIHIALYIMVFTIFMLPWTMGDGFHEWMKGIDGERINFGVHNAQHTAMLFAVALLFLISQLLNQKEITFFGKNIYLVLFPVALICLAAIFFTQTRAVWLGLVFSLVSLAMLMLFSRRKISRRKKILHRHFFILSAFLLILFLVSKHLFIGQIFLERMDEGIYQIEELVEGKTELNETNKSIGIRIKSWQDAFEWIDLNPLLGLGGRATKHVMQESKRIPAEFKQGISHLHSSYMDTLINYGILGLSVMLMLFAYLLFFSWQAWKRKIMPDDIFYFAMIFFPFWLIINIFESYMYFSYGCYVFSIVAGVLLSYIWKDRYKLSND